MTECEKCQEPDTCRFCKVAEQRAAEQEKKGGKMTKTVTIPACVEHQGLYAIDVTLNWVCPICGQPRGEVSKGLSYDGSRTLEVDCWKNSCGHIDKYDAIREEALKAEKGEGNE